MRMRQRYLWLALGGALVAIALAVFLGGRIKSASAQSGLSTGATVTFLVPTGTPITAASDVVIYIAQPSGSTQAIGCASDGNQHPIQSIVVTDPSGGRATRISGTITISQTAPVANGTRLGSLAGPISCNAVGNSYDKWSGTVQ